MARRHDIQDKEGLLEKVLTKERSTLEKRAAAGTAQFETYEDENDKSLFIKRALTESLQFYSRPCVANTQEAMERTAEYFVFCVEHGMRPTVEEYALALGTTRSMFERWRNGTAKNVDYRVIERAKEVIAAFDAKAVIANKMNPVAYIFRSKNYYGLRDQTDVVVTPKQLETKSKDDLIYAAEALPEE